MFRFVSHTCLVSPCAFSLFSATAAAWRQYRQPILVFYNRKRCQSAFYLSRSPLSHGCYQESRYAWVYSSKPSTLPLAFKQSYFTLLVYCFKWSRDAWRALARASSQHRCRYFQLALDIDMRPEYSATRPRADIFMREDWLLKILIDGPRQDLKLRQAHAWRYSMLMLPARSKSLRHETSFDTKTTATSRKMGYKCHHICFILWDHCQQHTFEFLRVWYRWKHMSLRANVMYRI